MPHAVKPPDNGTRYAVVGYADQKVVAAARLQAAGASLAQRAAFLLDLNERALTLRTGGLRDEEGAEDGRRRGRGGGRGGGGGGGEDGDDEGGERRGGRGRGRGR